MRPWRWQLEVLAVRHGAWLLPGVALALLAAAAWLVWIPARQAELAQAHLAVRLQRAQAARPAAPAQAAPVLPSRLAADQGMQGLFALARQHGLVIAQADYRRQDVGAAGRWQVQVPAVGTYPQVRRFLRAALQIPGLSLDEASLQRRHDGKGVEARLLFSIWYEGAP